MRRIAGFAWWRFVQVARWALLAYGFTAAMIEYSFVRNHVHGGTLVILSLSLIVYAVQVPALIAFTVARYETGLLRPAQTRRLKLDWLLRARSSAG